MAIASAVNTLVAGHTGTIAGAVKNRFYNETFLHRALPKFVHKQLGQLNVNLPEGSGAYGTGVVYWTRFVNLPAVSAGQGEGVPTTAIAMTAVNVTGTTAQYDAAVSISDIVKISSFGDIMKQATELLGDNAGDSIDQLVRDGITQNLTTQRAGGVAHYSLIASTGTMTITEIRKGVRTLKNNNAPVPEGGFYIAVMHPYQTYDLQGDTTTGGWLTANTYRDATDGLLTGEIGKVMGVRILETSNGKTLATSSVVGSSVVYEAQLCGAGAFGVTELQGLKIVIHGFGSGGVADPTDKIATAGWKTTFGTAILNSLFGVNMATIVSA